MIVNIQTIQPTLSAHDRDDIGSSTQVDVYSRYDLNKAEVSLRQLLNNNYGLYPHNNGKLKCNAGQARYRDSGLWYQSKGKHGEVEFTMQVGCNCEGDCCGHMCGLSITLQKTESHFTIIQQARFNY